MKYFAFGSNMSLNRLRERVPSCEVVGTFRLLEHTLCFHKRGTDGSAKCDAYYTGKPCDVVYGVLYDIDSAEKKTLDIAEGLGHGYEEKWVSVLSPMQAVENAVTYYATHIDRSLFPFSWYKKHVLVGANEAELPIYYQQQIEAIVAIGDPDLERAARQLAIHGL